MQIITRRSDPIHRTAFGTRAAAEDLIAAATPADWALEDPPDQITWAAPTGDHVQRDPAGPR